MIHKMFALYEHIPEAIIREFENEYDLDVHPKKDIKVIILNMDRVGDSFSLVGSTLSDYDSERNLSDTFYRSAPANSASPFPTLYVSEEGMKKDKLFSLESKDYGKLLRILKANAKLNKQLKPLYEYMLNNFQNVLNELGVYLTDAKKTPYILTICLDGLSIGKSPFYQAVREYASREYYRDFYTLGDKEIVGKDQICSMCRARQPETWGYVSIYNFYTSKTDLAPIAGGMKKDRAHVNYPVCPSCAAKLKRLKPVVNKFFSFKFCGFDYFLVPEVVSGKNDNEAMKLIVDIMVESYSNSADSDLNLKTRLGDFHIGKRTKLLDDYTKEVFDCLGKVADTSSYTMLFYAINNAEFKIQMTIEDIFPHQFRQVFEAKEKAEAYSVFTNLPAKEKGAVYNLEFRFDIVKEFFPLNDRIEGDFSKAFLEIVRSIFMQKKISRGTVMQRIMHTIRKKYTNDQNHELSTLKAFLLLKFMTHLGIDSDIIEITKTKEVTMNRKYMEFFVEHQDFFDSSAKQCAFLTGILAQLLINIQKHDKGAAPFRKRLNGLKLNESLIQRVFTEAKEKLEQYGKNYYQSLEEDIASLMVQGGMAKLSNDELSFAFTLGMTLSKKFKEQNSNEDDSDGGYDE